MLRKLIIVAAVLAVVGQARAQEKPKYIVIANTATKVTEMSKAELRALYAKKTTRWKDDVLATPFDLLLDAPVRDSFSEAILGKPARSIQTEWRQRIFAGQGTPPREVKDEATMVATVAATPGAIGYVGATTPLAANVRVINVTQ